MSIKLKKFILFLGDVIILFFALYLTLLIRYGQNFNKGIWNAHFPAFAWLYIIWLLIFYITNLYEINEAKVSMEYYQKILASLLICGLFSATYFYFNPKINIAPKTNLFLNILIIATLFSIWRNLFSIIIKSAGKNNLLFVGYSESAHKFAKSINNNPQMGYKVIAFADENADDEHEIKIFKSGEALKKFISENNINAIIINHQSGKENIDQLFQCLPLGVNFISFSNFYEKLFSLVPVDAIDQTWFIENLTEGSKKTYDILKRIFDVMASIILIIISIPIIPFIIIVIKLNDGGAIFFKQIRTGKNGKSFLAIKFRSMIIGSEKNGAEWSPENDPRITSIGKFLRKTRLDEIPQLFNVLRGEMSLVGPRPERPEFVEILEKDILFYPQRLLVKPGLTGWAQVNLPYGASKEYTMLKLKYDLYYIKHRSIALDFKIILKTIAIVFEFKGR
ncbi:MAG: sugar transferase [bacterium]